MHILVTTQCNQSCPYCFASDAMATHRDRLFMSLESFERCLDLAATGERRDVALFGGEPTLHPDFASMLGKSLDRGFFVRVFTNFLFNVDFERLHDERVTIVANINRRESYAPGALNRVLANLQRFCRNVTLGYNIYNFGDGYRFVLDLIEEHQLRLRQLRLGVASPTPTRSNDFIDIGHYDRVGRHVVNMGRYASARGIRFVYDCGFVRCMFNDEEMKTLTALGSPPSFVCGTPVDVGPALDVWHCFPLSAYQSVPLASFDTIRELVDALSSMYKPYQAFGVKKECTTCQHKAAGVCYGGCLGHVLATVERAQATPSRMEPRYVETH